MLSFYGRRLVKGTKDFDLQNLIKSPFFFTEEEIDDFLKSSFFLKKKKNLEIGFGTGENLIFQSLKFKNQIFLACDPFLTGSIKLLKKIEIMNIKNIYFSNLDFSSLYQKIRNSEFEKIFILFPDPWHKRRHFKRKLINQSFIKQIKLISHNKTSIVIATDDLIYQDIIRETFKKDGNFEKLVEKTNNTFLDIVDVIETKYYKKALKEEKKSIFFVFNKK
tara:strand:+ start:882 stop:1541 length:660 start_codon:yes stop_codon:yes gene_type:complete